MPKGEPAPKPESTKHLRVLANGAVYDMNKKRIVDSRNVTTKITKENAVALQSRQQELKREALARAANAVAVQGGGVDGRELIGDLAFVEAIGEAMTMKALTVNDPKAVDAARFLFQEIGIAERQAEAQTPDPIQGIPRFVVLLAELHERQPEVIDGLVTRTDILATDNRVHDVRVDEQGRGADDQLPAGQSDQKDGSE